MRRDLTKRYGNLVGGVDDIKKHKMFGKLDWQKLILKKIEAAYVPKCESIEGKSKFE